MIVLKNVWVGESFVEELLRTRRITTDQADQPEAIARALEQVTRELGERAPDQWQKHDDE